MPLTRRHFLQAAAAAPLSSAALAGAQQAGSESDKAPVVDCHVHCFAGEDNPRFPYHARAPYRPAESSPPERLLELMDQAGIDRAVIVHPEPYQDDHRYLEHCLTVGDGRLKGTVLVFSDRPDSAAKLPELARRLDVVAVRVHAYAPDRLPPFGKPELRALWKSAADSGLAIQLHFEPRYAPGFEPLIREFRDTTVIIDHLGRPLQGTPKEHAVVVRCSRFPNTVIKLSSLRTTRDYPHRDLRPIVKQLTGAYGAGRMIYGGGFGADATAESYRAAVEQGRSFIAHLSADEQAQVLGGNAMRLFKWS
ncbi:MAG: amidohydrolase family protein [Pirellulales bacterium]